MIKEDKAVLEIRQIRAKLENETKYMNPDELIRFLREGADKVILENNIKIEKADLFECDHVRQ